jgi:CDP-diglyceride synthetase
MNPGFAAHEVSRVFLLTVPLIVGGVVHMMAVKADILSYFKKPIHQSWFGRNKTWRGFLVMPLATWPGVLLARALEPAFELNAPLFAGHSTILLALLLGLGYCLAELPNSFVKRRLGVREGQPSERFTWFFVVLDQADSAIGCLLAYRLLIPIGAGTMALAVAVGTVLHLLINVGLYLAGIRKNPL